MHRKARKAAAQRRIQNLHRMGATAALLLVIFFAFQVAGHAAAPAATSAQPGTEHLLRFVPVPALFMLPPAPANNIFLAPTASGGANGSSCSSPLAYTYFNSSGNWTSSTPTGVLIGPASAVHLCPGTYGSGALTTNMFAFQGNGGTGLPITLIADQGPVTLTATYVANTFAFITSNGHNNVTLDGGCTHNVSLNRGCIPGTGLLMQATGNGTNLANQQDGGNAVRFTGGTNYIVQNFTAQNIYVHACTPSSPPTTCTDNVGAATGLISVNGNNGLVQWISGSYAKDGIGGNYGGGGTIAGLEIGHVDIINIDHGVEYGIGNAGSSASGLVVHDSHFGNFQPWDTAADTFHHDCTHFFTSAGGTITGSLYFYNILCDGDFGFNWNSSFFSEPIGGPGTPVYFNVVSNDQSSVSGETGCGTFCVEVNNATIYDSTVIYGPKAATTALNFYGSGSILKGNIVIGAAGAIGLSDGGTIASADYDTYYQIGGNGWVFGSFAGWQTSTHCSGAGCDLHGQNGNNPNLNATTYIPNTGSPVIGFSANLSALATGPLAQLQSSINLQTRPASGAGNWDGGAAQHVPGTSPPAAPANLTASVSGTSVALQWTAATGTPPITYTVNRGTSSGGPYSSIATGLTSTSYTDTGLGAGTYYYVVTAQNAGGSSGNSPQASATIVLPTPAISLSISQLTFPNTIIGNTASTGCVGVPACSITVTNTGTAALVFQSTALTITGPNAPDFGFGGACTNNLSLAPNATCVATATFAPSQNGAEGPASLNFLTNDPVTPSATVALNGTGVVPVSLTATPSALNFGLQYPSGATYNTAGGVVAQVLVANNSGTSVTITTITYTGTNPGNFGETDTCIGTLANGSTCTVSPTFTPSKTPPNKAYSAVLNITYTGAGGGTLTVSVNGTASKHHILSVKKSQPRRDPYEGYAEDVLLTVARAIFRSRFPVEMICTECFVLRPVANLQKI